MQSNDRWLLGALIGTMATTACPANAQSTKGQFNTTPGFDQYEVVVKFKNGATGGAISTNEQALQTLLENKFGITYNSVWPSNGSGGGISGLNTLNLQQIQSNANSAQQFREICAGFESLSNIDYCDLIPIGITPPSMAGTPNLLPAPTQSWVSNQGYLNAAPKGIDAQWAWSQGITGEGVVAHDAEWAWNQTHEEFPSTKVKIGLAEPKEDYADHGTAVLGEIMAADNGYGVTGAAHGLDQMWTYSEVTSSGRTGAIAAAIQNAKAGDVLILEMQTGGCHASGGEGQYGPPDYSQSVWDLVKQATDKGIIIVSAAGNGKQDLDNSCYAAYNARGDNGAIIVGANNGGGSLGPASFTTYGTRVNVQGWGGYVYSTGYGGLFNGGPNSMYTAGFSGTSSATPIVTGAVILIQSWAKKNLGRPLAPREMRDLLVSTGTPQGTDTRKIGPLPNVRKAIETLMSSNGTSSSSSLSSSALSSSSQNSSSSGVSSSGTTVNCSGYSTWQNRGYDWVAAKEYVTWTGKLWSHTNWVGGTPGVDAEWKFEGDCASSSSSSNTSSSSLQSSSSSLSSSSGQITNNLIQPQKALQSWSKYGFNINRLGDYQMRVFSAEGIEFFSAKGSGSQSIALDKPLSSGIWLVQISNGTSTDNAWILIP